MVVLDDANVDAAVKGVINGAYLNAGQVCMGVKRIIVQEGIYNKFKTKLVEETSKINVRVRRNGEIISKLYSHAGEGTGSVLRNIIEDTLDEYDDLSVNDRVSILLEMIEKIIK